MHFTLIFEMEANIACIDNVYFRPNIATNAATSTSALTIKNPRETSLTAAGYSLQAGQY